MTDGSFAISEFFALLFPLQLKLLFFSVQVKKANESPSLEHTDAFPQSYSRHARDPAPAISGARSCSSTCCLSGTCFPPRPTPVLCFVLFNPRKGKRDNKIQSPYGQVLAQICEKWSHQLELLTANVELWYGFSGFARLCRLGAGSRRSPVLGKNTQEMRFTALILWGWRIMTI